MTEMETILVRMSREEVAKVDELRGGGVSRSATADAYVNVHTTRHPGGEIRGQIAAD
jgi:CHRD domain